MRIDLSKRIKKYTKNVLVIILVIQICILSMGGSVRAEEFNRDEYDAHKPIPIGDKIEEINNKISNMNDDEKKALKDYMVELIDYYNDSISDMPGNMHDESILKLSDYNEQDPEWLNATTGTGHTNAIKTVLYLVYQYVNEPEIRRYDVNNEYFKNGSWNGYWFIAANEVTNGAGTAMEIIQPEQWLSMYNTIRDTKFESSNGEEGPSISDVVADEATTGEEPKEEDETTNDKLLKFLDGIAGVLFIGWKIIPIIIGGAIDGIMNAANGQSITIETILFNKVDITNINFFEQASGKNAGTINTIRENVSIWYISLRNLSAIILVLILIYVAIRMAISTVAEEKAKYKRMLVDWITSLCLLFVLHYIIVLVINLNNTFVNLLGTGGDGNSISAAEGQLVDNAFSTISFVEGVGNAIAYMMLAGMTFIYFIAYLKRMITIAFLIIIAPLITITYSIDKMGDGKSQALNTWLKEFTYNILIQPFQCVIYLSLGSAALSLLSGDVNLFNVIIAIYIFLFMYQAEEIVKNIFGFKSQSMAKTIAGAAITGAIISKGTSLFSNKSKDKKKDAGSGYRPRPQTRNSPDLQDSNADNLIAGGGGATPPQALDAGNANGNMSTVPRTREEVERAYSEDGFGKNNNGEYFNPWTDEYDKNYDPMNDPEYQNKKVSAQTANNSQGQVSGQPSSAENEEDLYTFRRPVQPDWVNQHVHRGGRNVQPAHANKNANRNPRRNINQYSSMPREAEDKKIIAGYAKSAGKWLLRHNITGGLKAAGLGLGLSSGDLKSGIAGWGLGSAQGQKVDTAFEKSRTKSNERTRFSRIANSIDDFQGDMSNTQAMQMMNDYLDGISMPDRDDEAGLKLYQQLMEEIQIQKDLGKSEDEAREIVDKLIKNSLSGAQSLWYPENI